MANFNAANAIGITEAANFIPELWSNEVIAAYKELEFDGYITPQERRGYFVNEQFYESYNSSDISGDCEITIHLMFRQRKTISSDSCNVFFVDFGMLFGSIWESFGSLFQYVFDVDFLTIF